MKNAKVGDRVLYYNYDKSWKGVVIENIYQLPARVVPVQWTDGSLGFMHETHLTRLVKKSLRELWIYGDMINTGHGVTDERPENTEGWILVREVRGKR